MTSAAQCAPDQPAPRETAGLGAGLGAGLRAQSGFEQALASRAAETEAALDALLPLPPGGEARVVEAMRYAALGGGKRLRAFLTLETAALFGVGGAGPARAAAAIECVHAYSLVHDDLPCMDDDDLRRGKPTVHIAFDEATAVLAGDALQTRAFEILAAPETHPDGAVRAELVAILAGASGAAGMVGGQMLDILAEEAAEKAAEEAAKEAAERSAERGAEKTAKKADERGAPPPEPADALARIERLQSLKTGALIRAAAALGAALGGADPEGRAALDDYAAALGLAFQIADDLLDVGGDEGAAGKRLRKDADAGKATFVDLLGVERARDRAEALAAEAAARLRPFGDGATLLRQAADFAVRRTR